MSDEALKALLGETVVVKTTPVVPPSPAKETPVSKTDTIMKWVTIHPKVKAAFVGVALIGFAAFDNAYNGGESYRAAAHEAGGAAIVTIIAYLKSA